MKFAIVTKHMHLVISYREPDEPDHEFVDNTGGDFGIAPPVDTSVDEPEDSTHFGFVRG